MQPSTPQRTVWIDSAPIVASPQPTGKLVECEVLADDNGSGQLWLKPKTLGATPIWVFRKWICTDPQSVPTFAQQMTFLEKVIGRDYQRMVDERCQAKRFHTTIAAETYELYKEVKAQHPDVSDDHEGAWNKHSEDMIVTPSRSARAKERK